MIVNKKMIAERKAMHGNNFPLIAKLFNNYLSNKKNPSEPLTPEDVSAMMMLMKISRLVESPNNEDTLTDLLNYAWIATEYEQYDKIEIDKNEVF